jgi:hypothetical protein
MQTMTEQFPKLSSDFIGDIQAHLLHSRVFCVTEKRDNVVMCSHYADQHKGVVLKLRCIDELDNPLLAAGKVTYSREFVRFPNPEEFARNATGEEPIDILSLSWDICYRKHKDWEYEQEWRVPIPLLRQPVGDGYSYEKEHPAVFDEAYLGCRMGDDETEKIIECIKAHLPHVKIYRAVRSTTSFNLDFIPVWTPQISVILGS